jgi:subtilisin-like proprotein convertase family protein
MVPNDGSETVIIPNSITPSRIMVRGHNNIFYDISNTNFNVTASGSTFIANINGQQNKTSCKGNNVTYTLNYSHINGFAGTTTFTATGNPAGSVVAFSPASMNANGTVQVTVSNTDGSPVGMHNIVVTMTSGATVKTMPLYLNLLDNQFEEAVLTVPANNTDGIPTAVLLDWNDSSNASSYIVEIATDEDFENIIETGTTQTSSFDLEGLNETTVYYWRVTPSNGGCSGNAGEAFRFATGEAFCETFSTNVPVTIPVDPATTVISQVVVADNFIIQDAQVPLNITHTWMTDLVVRVISPSGTSVVLFSNECGDQDNANATFDDSGTNLTCNGIPVISGLLLPEEPLSVFNGENAQGTWMLEVTDVEAPDGGSINSWGINLCGTNPSGLLNAETPFAETLNFTIYPNPNNGSFNIRFNSANGGNVAIHVYDMRGRRIFEKAIEAGSGVFTDAIQLNAESGVYIVNVEHNGTKTAKRIIIN